MADSGIETGHKINPKEANLGKFSIGEEMPLDKILNDENLAGFFNESLGSFPQIEKYIQTVSSQSEEQVEKCINPQIALQLAKWGQTTTKLSGGHRGPTVPKNIYMLLKTVFNTNKKTANRPVAEVLVDTALTHRSDFVRGFALDALGSLIDTNPNAAAFDIFSPNCQGDTLIENLEYIFWHDKRGISATALKVMSRVPLIEANPNEIKRLVDRLATKAFRGKGDEDAVILLQEVVKLNPSMAAYVDSKLPKVAEGLETGGDLGLSVKEAIMNFWKDEDLKQLEAQRRLSARRRPDNAHP